MVCDALLQVIDEINSVVVSENEALAKYEMDQLDRFAARKHFLGREFQRILDANAGIARDSVVQQAVAHMREKLAENGRNLQRRIVAVAELSDLIAGVCAAEASDGLYSRHAALRVG